MNCPKLFSVSWKGQQNVLKMDNCFSNFLSMNMEEEIAEGSMPPSIRNCSRTVPATDKYVMNV
jgi:hypothetical protein